MTVREFDSGANRDSEEGKYDFEGFLSPAVLYAFATYMHDKRGLPDGSMRSADNWQKGIPLDSYMKSLIRHVMDVWLIHRGYAVRRPEDGSPVSIEDALGGALFNVQGYWHETLKK